MTCRLPVETCSPRHALPAFGYRIVLAPVREITKTRIVAIPARVMRCLESLVSLAECESALRMAAECIDQSLQTVRCEIVVVIELEQNLAGTQTGSSALDGADVAASPLLPIFA